MYSQHGKQHQQVSRSSPILMVCLPVCAVLLLRGRMCEQQRGKKTKKTLFFGSLFKATRARDEHFSSILENWTENPSRICIKKRQTRNFVLYVQWKSMQNKMHLIQGYSPGIGTIMGINHRSECNMQFSFTWPSTKTTELLLWAKWHFKRKKEVSWWGDLSIYECVVLNNKCVKNRSLKFLLFLCPSIPLSIYIIPVNSIWGLLAVFLINIWTSGSVLHSVAVKRFKMRRLLTRTDRLMIVSTFVEPGRWQSLCGFP